MLQVNPPHRVPENKTFRNLTSRRATAFAAYRFSLDGRTQPELVDVDDRDDLLDPLHSMQTSCASTTCPSTQEESHLNATNHRYISQLRRHALTRSCKTKGSVYHFIKLALVIVFI